MTDLVGTAKKLRQARTEKSAVSQFSAADAEFGVDKAYQVQNEILKLELEAGEVLSGYKMGLTSEAKQRDVGVFEPIRGFLLQSMKWDSIDTDLLIHPRIEPEVYLTFNRDLKGGDSIEKLYDSVETIGLGVEVIDSRYQDFKFNLADVVADNTSASGFILGKKNVVERMSEVRLAGVSVRKNGALLRTGAPAAVLGNPLQSVIALLEMLGRESKELKKGMIVLTGGITAALPIGAGDEVEVAWPWETLNLQIQSKGASK